MTIFIISWFVSGLAATIATRIKTKMRLYVWIYSILGGYFSACYWVLCKYNKAQMFDKEI